MLDSHKFVSLKSTSIMKYPKSENLQDRRRGQLVLVRQMGVCGWGIIPWYVTEPPYALVCVYASTSEYVFMQGREREGGRDAAQVEESMYSRTSSLSYIRINALKTSVQKHKDAVSSRGILDARCYNTLANLHFDSISTDIERGNQSSSLSSHPLISYACYCWPS